MEKAAANAEEGARRRTPSFLTRRSLLICCSLSHAAAFNSPAILPPPRQTPPSARAALSHLRGAPHSAKPNEAGGGEAAAPCRPAPVRAGRRAARQPRLSKVRRLTRRRFMKVRIAAFCREFREIGHGESRGKRRGGGTRRRTPSSLMRRSLLICCSLSHAAAFNSPQYSHTPTNAAVRTSSAFTLARTCARRFAARA